MKKKRKERDINDRSPYEKEGYCSGISVAYMNYLAHRQAVDTTVWIPVDIACRHNYSKVYQDETHYVEYSKGFHESAMYFLEGLFDGSIDPQWVYDEICEIFEVPPPSITDDKLKELIAERQADIKS